MSNILTRTLTGIVYVGLIICSTLFNQWIFIGLFSIFLILGMLEFFRIIKPIGVEPQKVLSLVSGFYVFISFALISMNIANYKLLFGIAPLFMLIMITELYTNSKDPFRNIAFSILSVVYLALPFGLMNFFFDIKMENDFNFEFILGFFFIQWMNDIGAYLIGSKFGKHRLFERISPKKSWEGFVGGLLFAVIMALAFWHFSDTLSFIHWTVIAMIIVVSGTLGDLVESMLKRSLNIKDSGTILPGHGGILDRFDAVLISAPYVIFYLILIS